MDYGYGSRYTNPYYTQQTMPQMMPQSQPLSLIRVTGFEGAKAYPVPPNSVVPLFDGNDALFFVKSTDAGGFPTIKTYRFEEVTQAAEARETQAFATKDELEEIRDQIKELRGAIHAKPAVSGRTAKAE